MAEQDGMTIHGEGTVTPPPEPEEPEETEGTEEEE